MEAALPGERFYQRSAQNRKQNGWKKARVENEKKKKSRDKKAGN